MRVLFTASGRRVGGATMAVLHLMLGLKDVGIQPVLLSTPPLPRYRFIYRRLVERGVRVVLFGGRPLGGAGYWLTLFFEVLRAIRRLGVDLVHCHGSKEAAVVGLAAKLAGRPVVFTVEGDPLMEVAYAPERYSLSDRLSLAIVWFMGLRLADLVVGCSGWMAEQLTKRYGVEAKAAPNPIDYERFVQGGGGERGRVVTVARYERVKGLDALIRAAAEVLRGAPWARFVLVGEGSLRGWLQRLAERLGVAERIEFTGFREEVEEEVARAEVAALPSLYEPFGMAAAEALAAGKPVVAARTGGLQEIVREGVDGFLFKPGDHRELAEKLVKLLTDEELRKRMAQAAREGARRFSPEEVAKIYRGIYLDALRGKKSF